MRRLKAYIVSARPRTLPLSVAGVLAGILLAAGEGRFNGMTCTWLLITTLALQILANLANEIGDMQKGADNEHRLGPARSLQRGELSPRELITAARGVALFAIVSGMLLVREAFGGWFNAKSPVLLLAGGIAIASAVRYTVGRRAYGYRGLGDLFVMIFFGWVSLLGSYFAMTGAFDPLYILPATAIGAFSVMVLNLNNMRDVENDATCGKRTLPVILGPRRARAYHLLLVLAGHASLFLFALLSPVGWRGYLFILVLPLFIYHARIIYARDARTLDAHLPLISLATLLVSILVGARALL